MLREADLAILIKTYRGDLRMFERLVKSLNKHNQQKLPIFIVAPERDKNHVEKVLSESSSWSFLPEEEFGVEVFSSSEARQIGSRPGYLNQQIYKLAFSTLGLARHYFVVDSDVEFIRNFTKNDFFEVESEKPFIFGDSDKNLLADPDYLRLNGKKRLSKILKIRDYFDLPAEAFPITVHGMQVLTSKKILDMMSFLSRHHEIDTFKQMLSEVTMEFNWYAAYRLYEDASAPVRESPVKTYHHPRDFLKDLLIKTTENDLAAAYFAVCVNGNFQKTSKIFGPESLHSSPILIIGVYMNFRQTWRLFLAATLAVPISGLLGIYRLLRYRSK